jgi:molecular chaperone GrpE
MQPVNEVGETNARGVLVKDNNQVKKKAPEPSVQQAENSQPVEEISEETPELEGQLAQAQAQAADYLDGWQRARAELDNYRKRVTRERTEWEASTKGDVILSLLPALDDFDLALANLPDELSKHEWVNGIVLVHRKLRGQMEALGISEIETAGQQFDPLLHEAVTHEKSEAHQPGEIIDVMRKGYRLGDKVIRAAMVRVAS